jgi:FKBP-type peptidyl-prolyl cis-trans isomerase SlyD
MEQKQNNMIALHYQLYVVNNGEKELQEQTTRENPFRFISGFGISLDALEDYVMGISQGQPFELTLQPEQGFGTYDPDCVHKLKREIFEIDGKFDSQNIYPGAIITLNDVEGHRFMAQVTKIEDDGVTIDTNHPLAGKTLVFEGEVLENRPATDDEVKALIKQMTGGCSGCGGKGGCGGCGEGGCGEGGCGGCD